MVKEYLLFLVSINELDDLFSEKNKTIIFNFSTIMILTNYNHKEILSFEPNLINFLSSLFSFQYINFLECKIVRFNTLILDISFIKFAEYMN